MPRPVTIAFKQMKRYALGGFLADPGHAAQTVDQPNEQG
jgi:hypothetical protein